ncbi:sulfatase-like hydrolase/transferase [Candidatus Poribacteria bacterium]|nr:sulfatase-like hydrolase/transferase [Candidatus Poribacteria bacterium]MYB65429.1 sulfatase-like hydrolase/transferase [Candidatus Poribacteria bacterium]MYF54468.1 sulfatase-like hydrolase/transferase [Candidatus Poribacteria bacterium]MYI93341.1 sulfatase-like hydrolase/transferase [Candidatus Poribacteria bacterium]
MKDNDQTGTSSPTFSRREFISTGLKAGAAVFTTSLFPSLNVASNTQYNVLFIMVDDLRPLLGCYGHPEMHTPNIDSIAERGTVFNRAYCQFPLCSPSRTAIMTGLRPDTTRISENRTFFRETIPDVVTLPQHFKDSGYHTQSIGKVAHIPDFQDDMYSWSVPSWRPLWPRFDETTPSWQAFDVEDDEFRDGKTAIRAVQVLDQIKNDQFFLTVGFYKPHLPLRAPRKYFDLYENTSINIPFTSRDTPIDINPPFWNEVRPFADIPNNWEPIPYSKMLELIRAYAATISYVDAQIGLVLNKLDALGLTDNTVIVFCGDHGYHLGENENWGKNIVYEATLHSPLIVSIPGQQASGKNTDALVELVDVFPTLCDACQIPILPELEGLSMIPVIDDPEIPWKTATFSQRKKKRTIRTDEFRYSEEGRYKELYDYRTDPYSEVDVAVDPEYTEIVEQLSERLRAGWQEALPENIPTRVVPSKTLIWDINADGIVDVEDLLLISNNFGIELPDNPKVDVNEDGNVNIIDLLIVAAHLGESSQAGSPRTISIADQHIHRVEEWIYDAHKIKDASPIYRKGIKNLEMLINSVVPNETRLLPNYPNPFNPETWIPYDLGQDADVSVHIHNLKGEHIRHLRVGFQTAGSYRTPSRAVHWNGRNSIGEPVASGIYFYTFTAGDFTTTRKMLIRK